MKSVLGLLVVALLCPLLSSSTRQSSGSGSTKTIVEEIRKLEAEMMSAAAEKGAAGYLSYYAEDAVELPDGSPALPGKKTLSKGMEFLNDKNNHLTWTPVFIDVSRSGDLAYSYGIFEFRSLGKDGQPVIGHGKYTTIWKRQDDGIWKVVLDMGNKG